MNNKHATWAIHGAARNVRRQKLQFLRTRWIFYYENFVRLFPMVYCTLHRNYVNLYQNGTTWNTK